MIREAPMRLRLHLPVPLAELQDLSPFPASSPRPFMQHLLSHRQRPNLIHPAIKFLQRPTTLQAVPLFAVANFGLKLRKQIEGDVGRLKVLRVRMSHVMTERSER